MKGACSGAGVNNSPSLIISRLNVPGHRQPVIRHFFFVRGRGEEGKGREKIRVQWTLKRALLEYESCAPNHDCQFLDIHQSQILPSSQNLATVIKKLAIIRGTERLVSINICSVEGNSAGIFFSQVSPGIFVIKVKWMSIIFGGIEVPFWVR